MREIESPGVPVVAAINGNALGAGFETALACHHRIVIDRPKIKLGFPEVELGLIPGCGGIIRLMWLLGIERAYPILSSGHHYTPQEALKVGIIDELAADHKDMIEKARTWILSTQEGRRPWDRPDQTIPGGSTHQHQNAAWVRQQSVILAKRTQNNFPAQQAILKVLYEGSKVDFDTACRVESRYYTELVRSKACKNMIKAFWFDKSAIEQGLSRPKGIGKFRPRKVGIIGAGLMGSGIAFTCLINGLEVVLKDVSKLIAQRGYDYVEQQLKSLESTGQITSEDKKMLLQKISTTEDPALFESCDLVIEAVFENKMVKQKVTREAAEYMDEYSILATNTVSIPIDRLAGASSRPQNYIGIHFIAPAETVPLVEIVKGPKTSEETVARAFDFTRMIGKTPIVVKDDWGFYVSRVKNTYILEGITMLQEGYSPALIENLGRQAGMPSGPLAQADDIGLELVMRYEKQAADHYGSKYVEHPAVNVLNTMIDDLNRGGKISRAGFYDYQADTPKGLWPEIMDHFQQNATNADLKLLKERMLFAQVLEAIWCMQESVIKTIPEANLGSIYGWGFPAFKGGVIQYICDYGKQNFIAKSVQLKEQHGQRFSVPKLLHQLEI